MLMKLTSLEKAVAAFEAALAACRASTHADGTLEKEMMQEKIA